MRILILLLLFTHSLYAQQLPNSNNFSAFDFVWNPALTAPDGDAEISLGHWQQWSGVNDAPQTSAITYQQTINKQNVSIGGAFFNDRMGPIISNSFSFAYAYHLQKNRRSKPRLTLALNASLNHIFVNGVNIVVNNPNDTHIPTTENNTISPNVGFGLFYRSDITGNFEKKYIFAGIGSNQLIPNNIIFDSPNSSAANFKRAIHANATAGIHIPFNRLYFVRPSIWVNYSTPNIREIQLRVALEKYNSFWVQTHLSLNQILAFQVGTTITKGFVTQGALRIGAQGGFFLGTLGNNVSPGYSIYLAYRMQQ